VRAKILSHANTTLGKIPYGVPLGKICYAATPRKALYSETDPANQMPTQSDAGAGEGI
jgi:hypothetical protein